MMNSTCGRILVAEDDFVLSRVIQFNLQQAGYEVTLASHGREAIEQLAASSFDLLITDYQMPLDDGAAVCDYVRQTLRNPNLPIILCSAKGLELDTSMLQERWQLAAILLKPFSVREMLMRVHQLLNAQNSSAEAVAAE
jgi:CheY-like chemotaxis protein